MKPLERLVEAAVKRRGLVIAVTVVATAAALATVPRLSIDAVPDVTNVQVTILTTAPGLSPAEVEQTLLSHEAVWECAVVGAEDDQGLIKPLAFVVPNVGHQPGTILAAELIDFVKRAIAPYKYPRWIEFVDELPKGPHGKVLRYKLPRRKKPAAGTTGA